MKEDEPLSTLQTLTGIYVALTSHGAQAVASKLLKHIETLVDDISFEEEAKTNG